MKKIFIAVIIVTLLFPISSISGEKTINDITEITILMNDGFGLKFEICNEGNTSIKNINFTHSIDIPLIFGATTQMTINELSQGDCITIGPIIILGFGPATITIEISYDNVNINQTFKVFILGFFVIQLI